MRGSSRAPQRLYAKASQKPLHGPPLWRREVCQVGDAVVDTFAAALLLMLLLLLLTSAGVLGSCAFVLY